MASESKFGSMDADRVRGAAERQAILYLTSQAIGMSLDLEAVYQAVHQAVARLMPGDVFVIALLHETRFEIELVYLIDREQRLPVARRPLGAGLASHVITTGAVVRAGRPAAEFRPEHFGGAEAVASVLAVPLRLSGRVLGMLSAQSYQPDAYSAEDQYLLEILANQAAVAIENARLFAVEQRRNAELEALRQASLQLTASLELQPVLETIIEHALKLVSADDAYIFFYDAAEDQLSFGAARWADGVRKEPRQPRRTGFTHTIARTQEPVVIPDVNRHPLFQDWPWSGAIAGLPLRVGEQVFGVMSVAFHQPHAFDGGELRVLALLADQAAIAMENARLFDEVRSGREGMRDLAQQIVFTQELERKRIAQEIHDELGQKLTMLKLRLQLLGRKVPAAAQIDIDETVRLADTILNDIRRTAHGLQPPVVGRGALGPALRLLCFEFSQFTNIPVDFRQTRQPLPENVPESVGVTLYRVLQESLNNAARHGHADNVWVELAYTDRGFYLLVRDDGVGFVPQEVAPGLSIGLDGMRERLAVLGGRLKIYSRPGEGAQLEALLPLPEA